MENTENLIPVFASRADADAALHAAVNDPSARYDDDDATRAPRLARLHAVMLGSYNFDVTYCADHCTPGHADRACTFLDH